MPKFSKNKKLIKKSEKTFPRYMYLDGFGKFLVIFVQICEISFLKMYTFIYFTSLVSSYVKNHFHKNLQFCEGDTILNQCDSNK